MSRGSFGVDEKYSSFQNTGQNNSNDFTRLTGSIGQNIQKISQNVSHMKKLVANLGTASDNQDQRDKLHQLQHYTNQLAKDTGQFLKEANNMPAPAMEQRQRKMQRERLANEFSTALNEFQALQRKAVEKEKENVARARAASGSSQDPFAHDFTTSRSNDQLVSYMDAPATQVVQVHEDIDVTLIHEREQALHKLEQDIVDVNTIFKDLGVLVHEQGQVIDSIEANVETAAVQVEQGTGELSKARDYQSKARRKKFICILIVILVLVIIAIIIGVSVGNTAAKF